MWITVLEVGLAALAVVGMYTLLCELHEKVLLPRDGRLTAAVFLYDIQFLLKHQMNLMGQVFKRRSHVGSWPSPMNFCRIHTPSLSL